MLKIGIHEDSTNRTKIAEMLRVSTSKSCAEQISLKEYVDRMKEGQNDIYYLSGESVAIVSSSPFLENYLRKKGLEVLHMVYPVDEYALQQQLMEFDWKKLKSTTKEGLDIVDEDEKKRLEELKAEVEPLTKLMKEVFADKVEKVIVNDRIVESPCVLITLEYGWSANMEYHESSSSSRQFHFILRGVQEDHGGQPNPLHHDGVEEKGFSRQIRQD